MSQRPIRTQDGAEEGDVCQSTSLDPLWSIMITPDWYELLCTLLWDIVMSDE